jgi:predicted nucleic acid-binding protein
MALVIDASVAALWFLGDERGAVALRIVEDSAEPFLAPDLLPIEVANALWNARRLETKPISLGPVLEHLAGLLTYESSVKLLQAASLIARELDHPISDCVYLALVQRPDNSLVTADHKLARKLQRTPFAKKVQLLKA